MPTAEHFRNLDNSKLPQTVRIEYRRDILRDEEPDLSHLEQDYNGGDITARDRAQYRAADAKRIAAYHRGDWYMTGLRVTATILVPIGGNSFTRFELSSAGIWGVESDCGDKYREELFADQESELKAQMRAMGAAFNPELATAAKLCADRLAIHAVHGNLDVIDAVNAALA